MPLPQTAHLLAARRLLLAAFLLVIASVGAAPVTHAQTGGTITTPEIERRIDALLAEMTLEQKAGEMTQLTLQAVSAQEGTAEQPHRLDEEKLREAVLDRHVGSIFNVYDVAHTPAYWAELTGAIQDLAAERTTGVPVLYGIDAIHGQNYMYGATLFPHQLALAASWDPGLVRAVSRVSAVETRAGGIAWSFAPVLDMGRQPLWSRFFETFGEDVHLVSTMGRAAVHGLQDDGRAAGRIAATGKHFIGYGSPTSGKDRTPALIPDRLLHEVMVPPYRAAIDAGLLTVMINSGEINGVPVHSSEALLTDLLRDELGFEGIAVTDWEDVAKLHAFHLVAEDLRDAVRIAVEAGVDMAMVPYDFGFTDALLALVRDGEIPEARLDESVRRILRVKLALGLFDDARADEARLAAVGGEEAQALSRRAATESYVLLQNDGVLPLDDLGDDARILVTGPGADLRLALHGSWTYQWQGTDERLYPETPTIVDALGTRFGPGRVTHVEGATFEGAADVAAAAAAAADAEVAVVVLAEFPGVEQVGDVETLELPTEQRALAEAVLATGTPTVVVLIQNRPRLLHGIAEDAAAVLLSNYPGPHGGTALAALLAGDAGPSGRLPYTYPRFSGSVTTYDHKFSETTGPHGFNPQYAFGHGLGYTTFAYSDLALGSPALGPDGTLEVAVTVTNTGERAGQDVVQLYTRDRVASVTPPVRQLRAFEKVALEPGASTTVTFSVPVRELAFVTPDLRRVVEPGTFDALIGGLSVPFTVE
jgi:beta-glucosidase